MRTHSSESSSNETRRGTALARSLSRMFVSSPMAHAALRRTLEFESLSAFVNGSRAGVPIDARAIAASSPGDGCLKVSSAGLHLPLSQHFRG